MANTRTGKELEGQQYDPRDNLVIPYTEQVVNHDNDGASQLGDARTEVTPIDGQSSRVRVFSTPTTALEAYVQSFPGLTDLDLPDVLLNVNVFFNESAGSGSHEQNGDGISAGTSASLTLSLNSKSTASAAVMPELVFNIRRYNARNIPCMRYLFFMPGSFSKAELLTKLSTLAGASVSWWPRFKPESHTFMLFGSAANVSVDADIQQHVSISDSTLTYTWGEGEGVSRDHSTTNRSVQLPPTIHGAIDLGDPTNFVSIDASASASWDDETNWPARSAASSATASVLGEVYPTTLDATPGASAIPTSGLYVNRIQTEKFDWGFLACFVEIVDFADL